MDALDEAHAEHAASVLKALADPNRLRIAAMLGSVGTADVCVCDLTEPLGLSQPTVSHHMKVLRQAGIVEAERRGKWVHYRLADDLPAEAAAVVSALVGVPA
jgi:ArsR family transcriptional regulator